MNADAVAALRERFERLVAEYELRATQREASPSWEFAAEDIRVALAAAPLPEPVYDFAWLIERGQPEGQVPTVWWWLAAGGREGWTEVATEAFHFESREAAEEIIAAKFTPPTSRGEASARAVEHSFIAAAPLPSEPTHPHDGFAYDGCKCVCCVNIRALANPAIIEERDRAEEWADRLAYAIGGAAIGEHSNLNNPWQNALDMAAPLPSDTPADGLDVEELTDIIEQAIFETDTGLAAAMLAAGRIAALTQEPRSTREEDE